MTKKELNRAEQEILLKIAREALEKSVTGQPLPSVNLEALPPSLQEDGASFVTLTVQGRLRGCIGALQAYQPLAEDVQEHAVAAALQDPRFPNVTPEELPRISIEVSVLSPRTPSCFTRTHRNCSKKSALVWMGSFCKMAFAKPHFYPRSGRNCPTLNCSYLNFA